MSGFDPTNDSHIEIVALILAARQLAEDPEGMVCVTEETYDEPSGDTVPPGFPDREHYRNLARERVASGDFDLDSEAGLIDKITAVEEAMAEQQATLKFKAQSLRTF